MNRVFSISPFSLHVLLIPGILPHLVPPPTVVEGNSRKVLSVILSVFPEGKEIP